MLSTLAFATKDFADSSHYLKARTFTASATLQSSNSYYTWPYCSSSTRQKYIPSFYFAIRRDILSSYQGVLVCCCLNKFIPCHQWNKNKIKNNFYRLLWCWVCSLKAASFVGRVRSWFVDIHNSLDEEVKEKILFTNANGSKNSEQERKKHSRCCIMSTMICNTSILI